MGSIRTLNRALALLASLTGVILAVWTHTVSAWSDEGHMLLATVAKLSLPQDIVAKVEGVLHQWDSDYEGGGRMETAATWLDHVACREDFHFCGGYAALDDIQLFRHWHFSSHVLNPQKLKLPGIMRYYPLPDTGAEWALQLAYKSLMEAVPGSDETSEHSPSDASRKRGSRLSLNFHLRLLLHLVGDIHQPLHTCTLYAKGFPEGDFGGNEIRVGHQKYGNLHHFWDSSAGDFKKPFYEQPWDHLETEARAMMAQFPLESFKDRLTGSLRGDDFAAVVKESSSFCLPVVYSEFDWSTFSRKSLPYMPSEEYTEKVKQMARQQLTLGGYRLANLIQDIAPRLPDPISATRLAEFFGFQDIMHRVKRMFSGEQYSGAAKRPSSDDDDDEDGHNRICGRHH